MRQSVTHHASAVVPLLFLIAVCAVPPANAANFVDNLKAQAQQQLNGGQLDGSKGAGSTANAMSGALGSLGMPAMSSRTGINAAGVLVYCAKNKYLNASNAQTVKDKLLQNAGLSGTTAQRDSGYREGVSGLLQGSNGTTLNLDNIKDNLKRKACDYVLDHAKSFI
ncbi:hypothetical protein WM40_20840 [Robbsia andropogonis]|uniref:DUF2501 domain-containing protein n=1 Tax=Robbsia andropogonis TaxID=28092 RepID=A0A0F5JVZ0_9BURK|nr:DUF2501 domain-containing protein [Robbsia andropogonis]KKB61850.1 hypothetical protein WM40_20840 [Robbsia andropogonis]MCP1118641.1 DUF2501 domain-containing protein [Robbsia andropogonis]MCP1128108.1 DUF2501 domain-containing protein [Robbsia andropogonis]